MKWISLLLLSLSLTSCATIINGTTQKIPVDSYPQGANVSVDGLYMGITPTVIEVKRKHDHFVTFEKEGYIPNTVQLTHVFSGAVAGNLIAGGLIGWGVDACSGGQYRLIPESVFTQLQPLPGQALPMPPMPIQPLPMQSMPMEAMPVQSMQMPVETIPVESMPVQTTPVQPMPLEAVPAS